MRKNLLIALLVLLSFLGKSFALCAKGETALATSNNQKACQTIFTLFAIDFSVLSPRATAADVHINQPKTPCCVPSACPCTPQCCPCTSESSDCIESAVPTTDDKIIPIANKQIIQPKVVPTPKNKASLFRLDLFRIFKIQIL